MGYVIYFDLQRANPDRIHKDSCYLYRDRDRKATTSCWKGPYDTEQSARSSVARSLEVCTKCMR